MEDRHTRQPLRKRRGDGAPLALAPSGADDPMAGHQARHPVTSHRDASPLQGAPHLARALRPGSAVRVPRTGTAADRSASVEPTWPGRPFRTLIRTLKPVGIPWIWPEPTVTTVLSRNPPDVCRDSGMRYQFLHAADLELAAPGGEYVLHPVCVRPVPQGDDNVFPTPQDEQWRPVPAPGLRPMWVTIPKPGSRPATSRVTGLKTCVVSGARTRSRV